MHHYSGRHIEYLWQQALGHHLRHSEHVMDSDISKAGPCCLTIYEPQKRVPSRETNPFIPFWLSVLSMTAEDQMPELINKYVPEVSGFRDHANRFSLAMGARLREFVGYDQYNLAHRNIRRGMQVIPTTLFNPAEDNVLEQRPSTLSVIYSIFNGSLEVLVTMDSLLLHSVPFHSELSTISMWQETLAALLGKRIGHMNVVCGSTAAMQADEEKFRKVVELDNSPE